MRYFSNDPKFIIKELICQNRGTQSFATKQDMIVDGKKRGIIMSEKQTNDKIFDILITVYSLTEIEQMYKVGVSSLDIQQKYNITNYEVKKLSKNGIIKVTGSEEFRAFGSYHTAPLYSVFDFCRLTNDDVHDWLETHRGKRKKENE